MEQAFEQHGDVLAERGISKKDGFDDDSDKPEEQMIA
jgi:hypothetical protein